MKRIVIDFLHESAVAEVEIDAGVGSQMLPPIIVPRGDDELARILLLIHEAVNPAPAATAPEAPETDNVIHIDQRIA